MSRKNNERLECDFEVDIFVSCTLLGMLASYKQKDSIAKTLAALMLTCGGKNFRNALQSLSPDDVRQQ